MVLIVVIVEIMGIFPSFLTTPLLPTGMGHHNDFMGAMSAWNRDSLLNHSGLQQVAFFFFSFSDSQTNTKPKATLLHSQLQSSPNALDWGNVGLVVVSPFRRALQTCMYVVTGRGATDGGELYEQREQFFGHLVPFEVNPIVAEHSLGRSFVQKGDRFNPPLPHIFFLSYFF